MTDNGMLIKRTVESELSRRRAAMERELEARRSAAISACPRIAGLEREISSAALDFSNKIMQSPADAPALSALASELIAAKRREISTLLADNGFPGDALTPKPFCSECGDTGYAHGSLCACMRQAVINARFSSSGVNPLESFEAFSFDLLADQRQRRAMRRIYDYCENYAESFPDNDARDMLLMGSPGVGKTYLLNCIGGRVLSRGRSVLKLNAYRFIQTVMDSLREQASERPDFLMPELLIIDDLGVEPMINNITIESLLSVICERQDANRATLFATNHAPEELAQRYGSRIVSRLLAPNKVKVISIETDNVRLKNAK